MKSIKYKNGELYYHVYGSGKPVVLLSGGPGNRCQQIEEVALTLSSYCQTILIEQRGTGLSIPTPMDSSTINLREMLEDINKVLDELKLKNATFLGHSWGGTLAMAYMAKFPERVSSMVLVGPGFFSADKAGRKTFELNGLVRLGEEDLNYLKILTEKQKTTNISSDEGNTLRKIMYKSYVYDKYKIDELFEKIKLGTRNTLMHTLIWEDLDRIGFDVSMHLRNSDKPITVITGLQDPLAFVSYELKALAPRINMQWIQACGHYPMYEQPEKFYQIIKQILK